MKLAIAGLLVYGLVAVYSEPQFYYDNFNFQWPNSYFRKGNDAGEQEGRLFFGTQYITVTTSTITSTVTSTTSCTTSTAALSACVASGGRRRRNAASANLYYKESESDNIEDIFLPSPAKVVPRAVEPVEAPKETPAILVPFVVQPGYMARNQPQPRFLIGLTTATTTTTTTTTSVTTLTAICLSTTTLQLCGSSGK